MGTTYGFHNPRSLLSIVNDDSKVGHADTTDVWVSDPDDESMELQAYDDAKAVYNTATQDIFGIVTDDYQVINPPEIFGPLVEELVDRQRSVEGDITTFNGGARGYAEILLSDSGIWPRDRPERAEPVRAGITARWSHDGGISVRASAFAQDGMCENTMRRVSDSVYVKHAGDVDDRVDFQDEWAGVLNQLGAFSDALAGVIDSAMDFPIKDFREDGWEPDIIDAGEALEALDDVDVPIHLNPRDRDGINAMYELLGFPRYLAMAATDRVLWRLTQKDSGNSVMTAWDAYQGATYAITHEARFDQGSSSDDRYHRIASDILGTPQEIETEILRAAHQRLSPDDEAQQTFDIEDNVGDAMREYHQREQQMREALQVE